jgi:UDP-N-acetyl-D-galactosamine dehydrogenase
MGYHPEIILAGRRLNDSMGAYIAEEVVKLMVKNEITIRNAKCLILGFTFKENCPDVRNTKVIDIIKELINYNITPIIYDPWANPAEVMHEYGYQVHNSIPDGIFESAILAVSHFEFKSIEIRKHLVQNGVIFDVKGFFPRENCDARL